MLTKHLQTVISAHNALSHFPERVGERIIKDYSAELAEDIAYIKSKGKESDRYAEKYERYFLNWIHSRVNCVSWFIVGPAKLNNQRNQKRQEWAENHYNRFRYWRGKALKAMTKEPRRSISEKLEHYQKELEKALISHEKMKNANKVYNPDMLPAEFSEKTGFQLSDSVSILTYMKRYGDNKPFGSYALTNSRARIKALEENILKYENFTNKENSEQIINGVKVIYNYEIERIQLFYDGKPDADTITNLKRNAFKWSPKGQCWQRQLTQNAVYATKRVLNV